MGKGGGRGATYSIEGGVYNSTRSSFGTWNDLAVFLLPLDASRVRTVGKDGRPTKQTLRPCITWFQSHKHRSKGTKPATIPLKKEKKTTLFLAKKITNVKSRCCFVCSSGGGTKGGHKGVVRSVSLHSCPCVVRRALWSSVPCACLL